MAEENAKPEAPVAAAAALGARRVLRAGESLAGTMRRISPRHCVVTRAVRAELIDINLLALDLKRVEKTIEQHTQALAQLREQRAQLELRIAEFDAAPIDRVEGDPSFHEADESPATEPSRK